MTLIFAGVGTVIVLALGTLVLALTGISPVPVPGFPNATRNADRSNVHASPTPAPSDRAGTPVVAPDATRTATGVTPTATPTPTVTHGKKPTQTPTHPQTSRSK